MFPGDFTVSEGHGHPLVTYNYKHGVCVCVCVCLSVFTFSKLPSLPNLPKLLFTEQGRAAKAAAATGAPARVGGGAARAGHLLFSTVTFLPYTFQ
jgi:hypothetical protein